MSAKEHNRITPEGAACGREIARLCDTECEKLIAEGEWTEDERCASCAFRRGTVPNGCPQTQSDCFKAVMEREPFFCHVHPPGSKVCAGWFASVQRMKGGPKIICPWDFSPPDEALEAEAAKLEDKQ